MQSAEAEIDRMQKAYLVAVDEWIAAIRAEEALVSASPSLAEVDRWEQAHFREEEVRNKAKAAKKDYEAAVRSKFFGFH
jgi:hypothetical protein